MPSVRDVRSKIDAGKLDRQFRTLYGTKPAVIKMQRQRYLSLVKQFSARFGADREIELFSTPGRTEVGGNHTDHNAGKVLAAAVDLDVAAVAGSNTTGIVRVSSEGYPVFSVDLKNLKPQAGEKYSSAALVRGVCSRLEHLGFAIGGFDAVVSGHVPKGSGLSSSAAFEVLVVTIVNHLFNRGAVQDIPAAQIAQYAENVFFGKPCGLMDQTACACGGFVAIDFKNAARPIVRKIAFDFGRSGYSLVIVDTGGSHADLNDDYAALPAEMKSVAAALGGRVLRDVPASKVIDNMAALRRKSGDRAVLRALHFYDENQRVMQQVAALEKGNFNEFLRLIIASGDSSWKLNQNCYSSKNVLEQGIAVALAVSERILAGKGAWRVHGGGFAGTIQAFVPERMVPTYTKSIRKIFGPKSCHELMIRPVGTMRLRLE